MKKGRGLQGIRKKLKKITTGAENAFKLMREGRMSAPYAAPFTEELEMGILKLRRYTSLGPPEGKPVAQPLLLIPPLMVTSEIYDISPELSAVTWLLSQGIDVWLTDFGAPEKEEGWDRTLDDHILAIDRAIDWIADQTEQPVHLAGYSQGGMFAYQVSAYRKSSRIGSLITFGSPVDLYRNVPIKMHDSLTEKVLSATHQAFKKPLSSIKGIPGILNSYGFKLASPQQEVKHIFKLMGLMHDEEAVKRILPTRRFLGGEGFIAWPGPALRKFIEEYVLHNRLLSGGFVINGQSASLVDIKVPILYFVGEKDDLARPASVRAIRRAVSNENAENIHEVSIQAGHFGLVVGSKAMAEVWPRVVDWVTSLSTKGVTPSLEAQAPAQVSEKELPAPEDQIQPLYDFATDLVDDMWHRMGDLSLNATNVIHSMRWQLPRMAKIMSIRGKTRTSMSRVLTEQAEAIPDIPFFFWRDQVHTYKEANHSVNQLVAQLIAHHYQKGQKVGLAMQAHPGYLLAVMALNRLGAIPVLFPPQFEADALKQAMEVCEVKTIITDLEHLPRFETFATDTSCYVLLEPNNTTQPPKGCVPLLLEEQEGEYPQDLSLDQGLAEDTAMILFTAGTSGIPKPVEITNQRWSASALASAASCMLTPKDTVYCSIPLHRSVGMLLAVGGALVGGSRLAFRSRFSASKYWQDIRRLGVTVAFYTVDVPQQLLQHDEPEKDTHSSLRILVGNGMPKEIWEQLTERQPNLQIIEFYGATEGNIVLVNLLGEKPGSVGRPLLNEESLVIVQCDPANNQPIRSEDGHCTPCKVNENGLLLSQLEQDDKSFPFASYVQRESKEENILRDVFTEGDEWFNTRDYMKKDQDGDYWLAAK